MGTPSHGVDIEFVTSIVLQKTPDGFMLQFGSLTAWSIGLQLDTTSGNHFVSRLCASVAVCIDADDKQECPVTIFVKSIVLKKTPDGLMVQFGSLATWSTGLEFDTTVV